MSEPTMAIVAPRIHSQVTGEPILLADEIEFLLSHSTKKHVLLSGPGRNLALQYLATCQHLASSLQVMPPRKGQQNQLTIRGLCREIVITTCTNALVHADLELRLLPWNRDDLIEYLRCLAPKQVGEVLARVSCEDLSFCGSPVVWSTVLRHYVEYKNLTDLRQAILYEVHDRIRSMLKERSSSAQYPTEKQVLRTYNTLARLLLQGKTLTRQLFPKKRQSDSELAEWLAHREVLRTVVADYAAQQLQSNHVDCLYYIHACECVQDVARMGRGLANIPAVLRRCIVRKSECGTAARLLTILDKDWKPNADCRGVSFANADFSNVYWPHSTLTNCNLSFADLSGSNLCHSDLAQVNARYGDFRVCDLSQTRLSKAQFPFANLNHARLDRCFAEGTVFDDCQSEAASFDSAELLGCLFRRANLDDASFQNADLRNSCFVGASMEFTDLTNTNCRGVNLRGCKLRSAIMVNTRLDAAQLCHTDLEAVVFQGCSFAGASFQHAYLTGSHMSESNLRSAIFSFAGLADIQWVCCDLRECQFHHASFHMGSTRCGLVGSPYPSHGTRTGFYSDDYEHLKFKQPELIRKANLQGCDFRGANIFEADFYLVDVRYAKMDSRQQRHMRACGAILS